MRYKKDLAYYDRFTKELPEHEYLGDLVKEKLIYYPIVSREDYEHHGRLTDLMVSGKLFEDIGLPKNQPARRPRHAVRQPCHAERHLQSSG